MTETKISMRKVLGKGYNRFFYCRNFYRAVKGSRGSKNQRQLPFAMFTIF